MNLRMNVIDGCKKYHFVLFQSVVMIALPSPWSHE